MHSHQALVWEPRVTSRGERLPFFVGCHCAARSGLPAASVGCPAGQQHALCVALAAWMRAMTAGLAHMGRGCFNASTVAHSLTSDKVTASSQSRRRLTCPPPGCLSAFWAPHRMLAQCDPRWLRATCTHTGGTALRGE